MDDVLEVTLTLEEFQLLRKALWETTHCTETDLDSQKNLFSLQDDALKLAEEIASNLGLDPI
jgi:hypothetical protein